jgi:nicotinamide-nucleotide amidase
MDMTELVESVGHALQQHKTMVVTAESCTGGMIAEALTSVAGSTAWFDRAYVTYSYESKREMLGVHETTIQHHGSVSQECVTEMVLGALQQSHAQVSVACSGIAGPSGGSPDKPVGTVWLAWAKQGCADIITKEMYFEGDREAVRRQTTQTALKGILSILDA